MVFIEASVHLQERRELNTYSNNTNENALERGGLGASFDFYDGSTSRLRIVLSLFKVYPLPIFSVQNHSVPVPNQGYRGAQYSLNRDQFQYLTPKHDVHTSGTLGTGFADILPQKWLYFLSDLLKYGSLFLFTLPDLEKYVWKKNPFE